VSLQRVIDLSTMSYGSTTLSFNVARLLHCWETVYHDLINLLKSIAADFSVLRNDPVLLPLRTPIHRQNTTYYGDRLVG